MFKYNQFPILRLQAYNSQGLLHHKNLYLTSTGSNNQSSSLYSLQQVIDVQTSQIQTLKKIKKTKNLCKENTLSEISNQSCFKNNPNFIQIQEVYEDHENIYILMEENGVCLADVLERRGCLIQREVQIIYCQLIGILEVLRLANIFHAGISLENIFIRQSDMKIKLSGFVHSINMEKTKQQPHPNLYSGTQFSPYTAPQLLDNTIETPYIYYASDIWSIGVVLYTLLVGEQPFTNRDENKQMTTPSIVKLKNFMFEFPQRQVALTTNKKEKQKSNKVRGSLTPIWKELIKKIFLPWEDRLILRDLIQHPLNCIVEGSLMELNYKQAPRILNHTVLQSNQNSALIRFNRSIEQSIHPKKSSFSSQNKAIPVLNCSQLLPIPQSVLSSLPPPPKLAPSPRSASLSSLLPFSQKPLLHLGEVTTYVLSIILQQQKQPLPMPFISKNPSFIEKFCYLKSHNCIGYIYDNNIGLVFSDGSYAIGKNFIDYKYYSNQGFSIEDALFIYVGLYDRLFRDVEREKDRERNVYSLESDYVNQNSCKNIGNWSSNGSSQNNKSSGKIMINKTSHKSSQTSQNIQKSSHAYSKLKRSKMMQASHLPNSKPSLNRQISINQAVNIPNTLSSQFSFIKFGQSFLANSLNVNNFISGSDTRSKLKPNQLQEFPIPSHKYQIFKYFVEFFGDRVLDSTKRQSVLAFWRLNCGFVFLLSNGMWQVNLNQGINNSKTQDQQSPVLLINNDKSQKRKNLKNQYECAVIIDQYGLAWWLKPNGNIHNYGTTGSNYGNPKQKSNAFQDNLGIKRVNVQPLVNQQKLSSQKSLNEGYNMLAVKIARQAVKQIRVAYLRQFQDVMEPYKYAYP